MGLDMYLHKSWYIGTQWEWNEIAGEINLTQKGKKIPINFEKVSTIREEAAYWRKANQIHKWFVDNCQDGKDDCREAYVSNEQLQELLNICKTILNAQKSQRDKLAKELLPTQSGFFFGGTEYDSWYYEDLEYTVSVLEPLVQEIKEAEEQGFFVTMYYHSSW